nr:hypothetical protein [Tanacetum cinerariifolium]
MASLADKAILSGADNRPPMLEKDMYDSWKSRMELYMLNRPHGRMILESVEQVDYSINLLCVCGNFISFNWGTDLVTGADLVTGTDLVTGDDLEVGTDLAAGNDLEAGNDLVKEAGTDLVTQAGTDLVTLSD